LVLWSTPPNQSYMIREFSTFEQLKEIVELASKALPQRPDGVVVVAAYTSATRSECAAAAPGLERLARANPDTVFLRCCEEYQGAEVLFGRAVVGGSLPTYDVFYGGNRVARVEGGAAASAYEELQKQIKMHGMLVSKLDLFSEDAASTAAGKAAQGLKWGDGTVNKASFSKTPRTTNMFIPGYDWDQDKGFFDAAADKFGEDFESKYGDWVPEIDD